MQDKFLKRGRLINSPERILSHHTTLEMSLSASCLLFKGMIFVESGYAS